MLDEHLYLITVTVCSSSEPCILCVKSTKITRNIAFNQCYFANLFWDSMTRADRIEKQQPFGCINEKPNNNKIFSKQTNYIFFSLVAGDCEIYTLYIVL